MTDTNTGNRNTGNRNTGHWNTGHRNTGDWNTGNRNTGHWNTGDWNTGHWNTGDWNTGDWNTGDWNTGHRNTGDWNTGDWNTGDWNTGDWNTGCFNTTTPKKSYYFNVLLSMDEWNNATKPDWLYSPSPTTWVSDVDMTDDQKAENPTFHTCGGFLMQNDMHEEWSKAYATASDKQIQQVRDLPGFDNDVFKEITGLDLGAVKKQNETITIDGQTFELVPVDGKE